METATLILAVFSSALFIVAFLYKAWTGLKRMRDPENKERYSTSRTVLTIIALSIGLIAIIFTIILRFKLR